MKALPRNTNTPGQTKMFIPNLSTRPDIQHLFIRDLVVDIEIGAYEHERGRVQPVRFEADVWVRIEGDIGDDLGNTLNYDLLVEAVKAEAAGPRADLQETLVEGIAERLAGLPGVELVRVQSAKLAAYEDVGEAGVEIWRSA